MSNLISLHAAAVSAKMEQFLAWVAFRPRTEADALEAWQTHCPRVTVWEDALQEGLIELDPQPAPLGTARVCLTARGEALLAECEG